MNYKIRTAEINLGKMHSFNVKDNKLTVTGVENIEVKLEMQPQPVDRYSRGRMANNPSRMSVVIGTDGTVTIPAQILDHEQEFKKMSKKEIMAIMQLGLNELVKREVTDACLSAIPVNDSRFFTCSDGPKGLSF